MDSSDYGFVGGGKEKVWGRGFWEYYVGGSAREMHVGYTAIDRGGLNAPLISPRTPPSPPFNMHVLYTNFFLSFVP